MVQGVKHILCGSLVHLLSVGLYLPGQLFGSLLFRLDSLHQSVPLILQRSHPGAQSQLLASLLLQQFLRESKRGVSTTAW